MRTCVYVIIAIVVYFRLLWCGVVCRDTPVVCAVLNGNGQLMESLRMSNIRIRPNSLRKDAKKLRV